MKIKVDMARARNEGGEKSLGERARILIVDDDESIRKTMTAILQEEGYSVDTAENGKEAIAKSNMEPYNVALIDIRLPDIEGTELLTKIRDTTPRMRKILITGYPTLSNAMEAVNKRADAYLLKPFEIARVIETVKDQLEKQAEEMTYSEEKVAGFIETRVRELEAKELHRRSG
jgi:DNA-binding NtrC family response regulator